MSDGESRVPPNVQSEDASSGADVKSLQEAFELFTRTTQTMEESYRKLEERLRSLDQELQSRNQELALATDYLNSVLHSMSDGVVTVDTSGVITTFNGAAEKVLGYNEKDVVGRPFHKVFGREFAVPARQMLTALCTSDGKSVPVTERDSPIADRTNKEIGSVKVFQDLSEIEALREQVRHRDRLASLGEMAATVAHEIRNPLGGIRGFATLLSRDIPEDDPRSRLVGKIIEGTISLDAVVNELLEYTRPVDLNLRTLTCAELIERSLGFLGAHEGIVIDNRVVDESPIEVDLEKMQQVLLNILLNAVQSMADGGTITLETNIQESTVAFLITDAGHGIPSEDIDRVFFPFYTTKEKGTGLGLAVASKIVESHGGALKVVSEVGKGSTFRVSLRKGE